MTKQPWMGEFEAKDDGELVIKQIRHNCNYWHSDMCKRETVEKYCKAKGVEDPATVIEILMRAGLVHTPKKGYIALEARR